MRRSQWTLLTFTPRLASRMSPLSDILRFMTASALQWLSMRSRKINSKPRNWMSASSSWSRPSFASSIAKSTWIRSTIRKGMMTGLVTRAMRLWALSQPKMYSMVGISHRHTATKTSRLSRLSRTMLHWGQPQPSLKNARSSTRWCSMRTSPCKATYTNFKMRLSSSNNSSRSTISTRSLSSITTWSSTVSSKSSISNLRWCKIGKGVPTRTKKSLIPPSSYVW